MKISLNNFKIQHVSNQIMTMSVAKIYFTYVPLAGYCSWKHHSIISYKPAANCKEMNFISKDHCECFVSLLVVTNFSLKSGNKFNYVLIKDTTGVVKLITFVTKRDSISQMCLMFHMLKKNDPDSGV